MSIEQKTVAVLGASDKEDRYSNKAIKMLKEYGYNIIPVHPRYEQIDGIPVTHSLDEINAPVDILTVYLNPQQLLQYQEQIIRLKPGKVVFNPGTECPELAEELEKNRIQYIQACTLVLLRTGHLAD